MQTFDPRAFGAGGDGETIDSPAINAAIAAAAGSGGGTVTIGAGRYLCYSIRLLSGVTMRLAPDATIVAACPGAKGAYDPPEPRGPQLYQDFGHSHWHNSLIWGDGVQDVAIVGGGTIDGHALTRDGPGSRWRAGTGERPLSMAEMTAAEIDALEPPHDAMRGLGNKAIALRMARGVRIEGIRIVGGGHIAILASGVDDLDIEDVLIDAIRDGIDLDCVRRARILRCRVNTPNDDAIVVKASLALRERRSSDDILIRDCAVSGFDPGTLLDGSRGRTQRQAPDRDPVTGRIKIGTETSGDIRRVSIENCRFERSRGLAITSVDGGVVEQIRVDGVEMDEITGAPLFLRLGARLRGPDGIRPGRLRDIMIRGLRARRVAPCDAAMIVGLADRPVERVRLEDIDIAYAGPGLAEDVVDPPERKSAYPEASMFTPTPAWGLWARHVRGLEIDRISLSCDGDGRAETRFDNVDWAPFPSPASEEIARRI